MPRNDQVMRQLVLLQKLDGSRGATLQELAASLPEDLSRHPRTIRRDLEALELRFPLVIEQRNGQTRWRLMDGYRTALPLTLSATELMALVFSRDLLKPLEGTEIKASLDSALNKAAAALPTDGVRHPEQPQGHFSVGLGSHKNYRQHRRTIDQLSYPLSPWERVRVREKGTQRMPSIDLAFRLTGSAVPVDHGYALYAALGRMLLSTFSKISAS